MTYSPENKTIGAVFKKFAFETNIEGVNNAGRSRSNFRTIVWLAIFSCLVALTVRDIRDLVMEYQSQPVDVSTTLEHENAIDFPSVTICNKNKVSCKNLGQFLEDCRKGETKCQHPNEIEHLFVLGKCNVSAKLEEKESKQGNQELIEAASQNTIKKPKRRKNTKAESVTNIKTNMQSIEQSVLFAFEQEFLMTYLRLSEEEKFQVGHHFRDLLVTCTFRGVDCKAGIGSDTIANLLDYEVIITPTHGNCYTLYSKHENFGKSSFTGGAYGLSLVLNVEQSDYLRGGQTLVHSLLTLESIN